MIINIDKNTVKAQVEAEKPDADSVVSSNWHVPV